MATLLDKLEKGVFENKIKEPFTTSSLKVWIKAEKIINDETGEPYTDSYIESFLSSSVIDSTSTKWDKNLVKLDTTPESYKFINKNK